MKAAIALSLVFIPTTSLGLSSSLDGRLRGRHSDRQVDYDGPTPKPEELCSAFMIHNAITRRLRSERDMVGESTDDMDLRPACEPLHTLSGDLCPRGQHLLDTCENHDRIDSASLAVRFGHCEPLLAHIYDDRERMDCIRACVNYVSPSVGDCCQLDCRESIWRA